MQKFFAGQTKPGATAWQDYPNGTGVFVDVDTSGGHFATTPIYLSSLGGISHHWATTGATSIYNATATGFRIYIRWADGKPMSRDDAYAHGWFVNWVGIETTTND
jgi:hypothetical protein